MKCEKLPPIVLRIPLFFIQYKSRKIKEDTGERDEKVIKGSYIIKFNRGIFVSGNIVSANKAIVGTGNGLFEPEKLVTREQYAKFLNNTIHRFYAND
ncbi:S-layer homology domain-containing protein [Bacillus mycoides]|uniref:S-layer homology domain-containing protein n=1 Tax=Bacillus cereus group TaxID=86661 RepID=UPI00032FC213|nr:S-layer homology domain-containing protein [Bacillus mycoides]EOO14735.1 hypothetical protein IG9_03903 [Bacillus cereus HuA2-9]MCZ6939213.1 hypothetical protein [Bacillus mycoides]